MNIWQAAPGLQYMEHLYLHGNVYILYMETGPCLM